MANADDFRSLTEDMAGAYKDRVVRIKAIKRETAQLRKEAQKENQARAADVSKLLGDFDKAHQEMAASLKATLAEVKPTLAKNEAERKSQAVAEVKQRAADVSKLLGDFDKAHQEMAESLKATLAEVKPTLAKNEAERKSQAVAEVKQRAADVAKMVDDFDKAHAEMAESLKATLAEVKPTLAKNEAERKSQAVAEVKQRAADVASMLDGFRKEQGETAAAWQELLATMRSGREAKPLVKKKLPEVRPPVEKPPSLEGKVLTLIKERPEGLKLSEMEKAIGKARIVLAKVGKKLINQGKVKKEGPLYLPAE